MLVLGLAASFAPAMFRAAEDWPSIHAWLVGDTPQPQELKEQVPDQVLDHIRRIRSGFESLRTQLMEARAEVLVMLASDDGRMFTGIQVPQFCTFLGEEIWGSTRYAELGETAEDDIVRLPCAPAVAAFVQRELVSHSIDMNYSQVLRPLGQPEFGSSASLVAAAPWLLADSQISVVPIYVNCRVAPCPSGHRCYAVGQALAEILDERPERIAVFASGGLSHDHHGPRAGWVDPPLDEWLLDQLARGRGANLGRLFEVDSDTVGGGVAETRLWAAVAGACEDRGGKARVLDYIPSYAAATGIGFAYWPLDGRQEG